MNEGLKQNASANEVFNIEYTKYWILQQGKNKIDMSVSFSIHNFSFDQIEFSVTCKWNIEYICEHSIL